SKAALARPLPRRLVLVGFLALRGRQAGIVRRLGRPGELVDPRLQLGNQLQRRLQTRRQRQDQRILLRMGQFAEVGGGAHPDLRMESPVTASSGISSIPSEPRMSSYKPG